MNLYLVSGLLSAMAADIKERELYDLGVMCSSFI